MPQPGVCAVWEFGVPWPRHGDASHDVDFRTSARVSGLTVTVQIPVSHLRPPQLESEPPGFMFSLPGDARRCGRSSGGWGLATGWCGLAESAL